MLGSRRPTGAPAPVYRPSLQAFTAESRPVVTMCHPQWRGILAAAVAQDLPLIESEHPGSGAPRILDVLETVGTRVVIVNGFPPGTSEFAATAVARGVKVRVVMHSSMAQHGYEPAEAAIIDELCRLVRSGVVDAIGFGKEGQAEAFVAMGCPAVFVPPRIAGVPATTPADLGTGLHFGIFAEATWRKNVTTQIGAAAIAGATAHVSAVPDVAYLGNASVVAHGLPDRDTFLSLLAGVDLNLSVSLYECFPVLPQESYQLGTPCLVSRTSALFRSDDFLWDISTVAEHDNPSAIAASAERLIRVAEAEGVVDRAKSWFADWNDSTAPLWTTFTDPDWIPA